MKYNVSYERRGVPQTIFVEGPNEEVVKRFFQEYKPDATIYGVDVSTRDDERPGKSVIEVPEGYEFELPKGNYKSLDEIFQAYGLDQHASTEFRYQLLSRMKMDCEYYLGHGNRYAKHLWAGDEREQVTVINIWRKTP